jgi:hypothetical protein
MQVDDPLIHQTRPGLKQYPIHASLLESEAVEAIFSQTGSYLLPQADPEGCPTALRITEQAPATLHDPMDRKDAKKGCEPTAEWHRDKCR